MSPLDQQFADMIRQGRRERKALETELLEMDEEILRTRKLDLEKKHKEDGKEEEKKE